ncbi:hypothetical protein DOS70_07740 [Staphylococcus felis]|uniref:Uncharacterized protein n=2 Tax=Staphylococcus felis TaxID=46127 RepID=A0A2K3ZBR8_9STAP|nr:hypothetical protein C7J90_05590 [Staphylococcus felis]MBH9582102.1 hypothetical protein [Staphylococcus felis]PNZ35296.1 hypothetical protein CD143_06795 [Staphylococcus felis]QQB04425.1 hypothetical protein I6H71_01065 [Staphylococcus felis]REH75414.1 hypothetical protein DOS59_10405 [Staphylococcus felis]
MKKVKTLGIISNILLVLGLIFLFIIPIVALLCFIVTLSLSLVLFNMIFKGKRFIRIIVNISYVIVLILIITVIYGLR